MMEYITRKQYFPGALSDAAAELLKEIWQAIRWTPCWGDMTKAQIDAFGELMRAMYIESCAWGEYRVKGRDTMSAIRQYQQERNGALLIRASLVSVGVSASNIKAIYKSPNGFAANSRRWCITLYAGAKVSATQINTRPGLSGAVINGNQIWVILGELEKAG
jgi:hypothetical protein